jgi:Ca2+-binding EF-hand superfamily protein
MGSKQSKPVLDPSQCLRLLDQPQLAAIRQAFAELAGDLDYINRVRFLGYLSQLLRGRFSAVVVERLMAIVDSNGDGSIQYEEFLWFSFLLRYSNREDKLKLLFNLYDLDASGFISKKHFRTISVALLKGSKSPSQQELKMLGPLTDLFCLTAFQHYQSSGDKKTLSFNEWRRFADEDEVVLALLECLGDSDGYRIASNFTSAFSLSSSTSSSLASLFPEPFPLQLEDQLGHS